MFTVAYTLILITAAVVAAFGCVFVVVGAMQFTAEKKHGYFHWIIPAMLLTTAMTIALSGRSIEFNAASLVMGGAIKHPLAAWVQRIATVFILTASAERIISHFSAQRNLLGAAPALTLTFIAYWFGSQLSPMFFSAYPSFSHDAFYPLIIGCSALLLDAEEAEATLLMARNALFVFLIAGYLLLPVNPNLVLDTNYTQGLIAGLPRFAGLSPHAVAEGMLAQLALLCVWARPYATRRLNTAAWLFGLFTLFIAQSKTGWISFCFCALVMYLSQNGAMLKRKLSDPQQPQLGIAMIMGVILLLGVFVADALFGNLGAKLSHFLSSESGAQLTSLTGRDLIWSAAYQEWLRHPIFGYGPSFLDKAYRIAIGLPNATHGHNQYMDLLPRAGLAGAVPLTFYLLAMLSLAIRHAVASRGLTLALFLALALRAVSEVPLTLSGYGAEFSGHLLLIVLLTAYNARVAHPAAQADRENQPGQDIPLSRTSPQT